MRGWEKYSHACLYCIFVFVCAELPPLFMIEIAQSAVVLLPKCRDLRSRYRCYSVDPVILLAALLVNLLFIQHYYGFAGFGGVAAS